MREGQGKAARDGVHLELDSESASLGARVSRERKARARKGRTRCGAGLSEMELRSWEGEDGVGARRSGEGPALARHRGCVGLRPRSKKERGRDDRRDRPVSEREREKAACWACLATGPWPGRRQEKEEGRGDWAGGGNGPKEWKRREGGKKKLFPGCLEFGRFWRDAKGFEFKL